LKKGIAVAVAGCGSRRLATGLRETTGPACAQVAGNGVGGVISFASLRRVLSGRGQQELIASTARTAQSQAIEAQDALQVGEQHLDFLPMPPRAAIGVGLGGVVGQVTSTFVNATRHLPGRLLAAAARLEAAGVAVILAGAIEELIVVHGRALQVSILPPGQT
jgi:hypothetical protein